MADIRSHVIALNEKRARVWSEAQNFLDRIETRGGSMGAEDSAQWKRYNDEIANLDAEVREYVEIETREHESAQIREMHPAIFGGDSTASLTRATSDAAHLRSVMRGEIDPRTGRPKHFDVPVHLAARERQLLRDGADAREIRTMVWDTGSVGSTVPVTMARSLYEYMEASVSMFRAPTSKVSTTGGENMDFPKLAAHSIGTQVIAQGTAIAGTDPTFAKMTLGAYKYGQLAYVASEVVEDSSIDILAFVGRDIGRGLGRLINTDLVVGSGTGEPNGIMTAAIASAGSVVTGGSLIKATYETLIDLAYGIPDSYRGPSAGWLMKDSTAAELRKLRDGAGGTVGAPLWEPSLTNGIQGGQPDRLLGYAVYPDPNVAAQGSAASAILFADFSAYYVRTVGSVRIERSDDFKFDTDLVAMRGKYRVDGDLIDSSAVVRSYQLA